MPSQEKSSLQRMSIYERPIFHVIYTINFIVIVYLFVEAYALSRGEQWLSEDNIQQQKTSLRMQLSETVKRKREMTKALALSVSESVVTEKGNIVLDKSVPSLERISNALRFNGIMDQNRFKIIDANGICVYRSWSSRHGDRDLNAKRWLIQMDQKPIVKDFMEVDENSLIFKALYPIMDSGVLVGMLETMSLFDPIVSDLTNLDEELVVAIDRRYRDKLTHPYSKEFIDGYNIVNAGVLSKGILRDIQGDVLYKLVTSELMSDKRVIEKDYLLVTGKIKAWDHSDLAYLLYFKKRKGSQTKTLANMRQSITNVTIVLFFVSVMLSIALTLRYLFARSRRDLRVYDELTGLRNKTKLLEVLAERKGERLLVIANVNNFSNINIVYDFEMGDQILQAIARRLTSICECVEVFRIDADEFGLLYESDASAEEVIRKVQSQFFEHEMSFGRHNINVTFTYGAAKSSEHLFRIASFALRKAKRLGPNQYHIYDNQLDRLDHIERSKFLKMSSILHNALENDRVIPYFQGIRDNRTQKIEKFESLVRIEHEGQILSPYKFIEVAQTTGQITRITQRMIEKTFEYMRKRSTYSFSINITEDDLNKNYLITFLQEMLKRYEIEPERVTLEILEGISSSGNTSNTQQFQAFKKMGLKLAIDDFGAEYSNFERVLDLDADFLKIDAKYIKDIDVNIKSYEITKSIASFAKNTNILCIAEFVASESIQKIIEEFGIEYSQGYHFSKPQSYIVDRKRAH